MYLLLINVRYDVALVLTSVENLVCTLMEDSLCSLRVCPHPCSRNFKRMYRLLINVQYDVALVLTSVEILICTSMEDSLCSLSVRLHLCSRKYDDALLLYHD